MATAKFQNIDLNIPDEGQLFKVKGEENMGDPYIYKRVGEQQIAIPKSLLSSVDYNSLNTYNPGDVRSALGQVAVNRNTSLFGGGVTYGKDINAMEQTRIAQGLPVGTPLSSMIASPTNNIATNPTNFQGSVLGNVAQGLADVQNRINALGTKPISTQALTQSGVTPFVSPQTPTIPPNTTTSTGGIYTNQGDSTSATLTPKQQEAQSTSERLQKINDELAGKTQYTLEQQKALGVTDIQNQITTLTASVNEMTAQEKEIQNQINNVASKIRESFTGRASEIGMAPVTASEIRNLQGLASAMASDRLAMEGHLAALQGNLKVANDKVAQSVATKYAPLEAELAAKSANLSIIEKSPQYTADEKKQAAEVKAQIDAQQTALADKTKQETSEKLQLIDIAQKYPDAGIDPSKDTFVSANQKVVSNSKIYQSQTRLAGSGVSEAPAVSLYSDIMQQAIDAGAKTSDEIVAGVQAVADSTGVNLTVSQLNAIKTKANEIIKNIKPTTTTTPITQNTRATQIESEIQKSKDYYANFPNLPSSVNVNNEIKSSLISKGFSNQEIIDSSLGSGLDKFVTGISNFLFGK